MEATATAKPTAEQIATILAFEASNPMPAVKEDATTAAARNTNPHIGD